MSWICGRVSLISLFFSICCLCLLAFFFDLKIENVLNFRAAYRMVPWTTNSNKTVKTILFWNGMFGDKTFYFGEGDIFLDCPVNECLATYDRSLTNTEDFDAILFHGAELNKLDLPEKRTTKQYYVFVNLETPINRPINDYLFEDYFNTTMTYRLDSDVVWPYGVIKDLQSDKIVAPATDIVWDVPTDDEYNNKPSSTFHAKGVQILLYLLALYMCVVIIKNAILMDKITDKTKEVAWLVSNCPARSGRWEYVKELSKYIKVDIYGSCGDRYACPYGRDCFRELFEPNYFFYLSFENSLCQDYVTEKLYKTMRYDVIPIVYGGANYSRFVPPNSYINALDFDSPKYLAMYLKELIANPREYRKYFRWKERYRIENSNSLTACDLCKFLHAKNESKTYKPLSQWYSYQKCPLQRLLSTDGYVTKVALKDYTN